MITAREKADCALREVKQRQRVYPRLVEGGKMTQAFAEKQTAIMQVIADDYARQAEEEEKAGRLI